MNIYERLGLSVIFIPNNCQCSTVEIFLPFISSKYCVALLAYIKMQLFLLHLGIWPNAFTLHLNTVNWLIGFSSRKKLSYFLFLFHMNKKIHSAKYSVWIMFFDCCCFQRQQSKLTLRTVFLNIKQYWYLDIKCTCMSPIIHKYMLSVQKCMKRFYQWFLLLSKQCNRNSYLFPISHPFHCIYFQIWK